jgi:anti-sigma regulatory factor (Ser/Thr protein kinase)
VTQQCHRSLAPERSAGAAARRALDGFRGELEEDVVERSALVVTEVVTNSVMHASLTAAQPIDLNIELFPGCLRIEVTDEGTQSFDPVVAAPHAGRDTARGLWMIDQLTDRWGVDFTHSTHVWCEFDLGG